MKNEKTLLIAECNRLSELLKNYKEPDSKWHPDKTRAEICRISQSIRLHTIQLEKIMYGRK